MFHSGVRYRNVICIAWRSGSESTYFQAIEIEISRTIRELIKQYRKDGRAVSIASTSILGITMPTQTFLKALTSSKTVEKFVQAEKDVNRV